MTTEPPIVIAPILPEQHGAARNLLLHYLIERWGTLNPALNPDLDDIAACYANGLFVAATRNGELIGTGAIVPEPNEEEADAPVPKISAALSMSGGMETQTGFYAAGRTGRIVRMAVAANVRRAGVGRAILQFLCDAARERGYHRLVLETTADWQDAVAFYTRFGFAPLGVWDGDAHFALDLAGSSAREAPAAH